VAYNKCSTGAALSSTALNGTTAIPTLVSSSIFWGNGYTIGTTINNLSGSSALSYCTTQGTSYNTAGATTNNTTNPAFLRDYHAQMRTNPGDGYGLSNNSPMIDRGAGPPPALDMDGQTRKRVLASYITSFVSVGDRGAFEFNDDDGDNLPGGWESLYGFDPANPADRDLDFDQDGYTNYEEYAAGTDPRSILSLPGSVIYVAPGANGTGSFASPLSSIKDALLVVANGGRIALRDGVFGGLDNLDLVPTKAVTIVGINGSGRVAVDGGLSKRFIAKATAGVTLNGITVRNCKTSSGNGGAINMIPTPETTLPPPPPTLLKCNRCRFINCRADAGNGGAIYMAYGNLVGCEFLGNTAKEGGAVGVDGTTNPPTALGSTAGFPSPYALFVQGNTFAWNDASVLGGAISCNAQSFTQISSNSFYRNSSPAGGH
jgi:hypothetical protein